MVTIPEDLAKLMQDTREIGIGTTVNLKLKQTANKIVFRNYLVQLVFCD